MKIKNLILATAALCLFAFANKAFGQNGYLQGNGIYYEGTYNKFHYYPDYVPCVGSAGNCGIYGDGNPFGKDGIYCNFGFTPTQVRYGVVTYVGGSPSTVHSSYATVSPGLTYRLTDIQSNWDGKIIKIFAQDAYSSFCCYIINFVGHPQIVSPNNGTSYNADAQVTVNVSRNSSFVGNVKYAYVSSYDVSNCTFNPGSSAIEGSSTSTHTNFTFNPNRGPYVKMIAQNANGEFSVPKCIQVTQTVTFDKQGGSGGSSSVNPIYGSPMPSASAPSKTGYGFGGYYTSTNGGGTQYYTSSMSSASNFYLTGNPPLYAKWTANTYTVSYNGNGNTGGSTSSSSHTYDVSKNLTSNGFERKYTVTFNPENGQSSYPLTATYTFVGWATSSTGPVVYTNGQSVMNLTSINGETFPLYAKWNSAAVTLPTPTRLGYTFVGWYDGNTYVGNGGASYTPTAIKTLYAKWTANTYYIAFNNNGGSGSMTNQTFAYDASQKLKKNTFTKTDYTFTGWNTNAGGTGTNYSDEQTVLNLMSTNDAVITFFAQWTVSHNHNIIVGPLLTTTWNQWPYYNDFCPPGTPTGCVATAMAQIMKYHNHPAQGTGSHSYSHATYGTLSADFGATTYQWNNMPSSLTAGSTPEQKNAVATLMYHCGVAVEMNYTPSVSLANSYSFKYALPTYFKYDGGIDLKQRSEYFGNDAGWHDLLKNELDAGRPIFYAGASSTGGHAFVCDGYDDGGCFHFNWGWSGSGDGWYVTSNLVNGYNNSQEIVLNIKPALPITVPINDQCVGATSLHCGANLTGQTTVGSTAKTEIVATNASPYGVWYSFVGDGQQTTITSIASAGFNHSMGIYSGSCGSLTHIITKDNSGPGGTETHTFNTTSGTTYYVYIAHYSTSGNSTQTGTFSISRICIPPEQASLQFLSLEVSEPLYQNMPGSFTATLKNNGTVAYNSRLWIHLEKLYTYNPYQWVGDGDVYFIDAGETIEITITDIISLPPDVYNCNMIFDANNDLNNMDLYLFGSHPNVQVTVLSLSWEIGNPNLPDVIAI